MKKLITILVACLVIVFGSCKKDKKADPVTPTPVTTGNLKINFVNMVDTVPLVFGQNYLNPNGDTFKISKFNYFISNIVITKNDNSTFTAANSYHVVRHSDPTTYTLTLPGVPFGSYKAISFMLGVDSTRNVSGAQAGELDPVNSSDMYWDWTTGYITLKLEGTSPKSGKSDKSLTFHIGGYGGVNKAQRNFTLAFGNVTADVASGAIPMVQLAVNANQVFKSPNTINFATQNFQTSPGPGAKVYADNYADMITFKQVQH